MKQSNDLAEQNRQTFYDLLRTQRENFDKFYKDQVPYFVQDANAFLSGLSEDEKSELYNSFSQGQFTKSKSEGVRTKSWTKLMAQEESHVFARRTDESSQTLCSVWLSSSRSY
jgi:hypothetical protein